MSYCLFGDVQKKLQQITLDADSNPSSVDVTEFCTQISTVMDARFQAAGITVPITDSDKLIVVKKIAVDGVAAEVLRSIEAESEEAAVRQKLFDDAMKNIEKHPGILKTSISHSSMSHGFGTEDRHFEREEQMW